MEWTRGDYFLTDDHDRADVDVIHALLRDSYWADTRSREAVAVTVANSICFSLFHRGRQVGVARVISDYAATSYLSDVVLEPAHRSNGVGTWLMRCVLEHPSVRRTRALLVTKDAQDFYRKFAFEIHPGSCMVRPEGGGST